MNIQFRFKIVNDKEGFATDKVVLLRSQRYSGRRGGRGRQFSFI